MKLIREKIPTAVAKKKGPPRLLLSQEPTQRENTSPKGLGKMFSIIIHLPDHEGNILDVAIPLQVDICAYDVSEREMPPFPLQLWYELLYE
jgi:hypothetical protein